MSNHLSDSHNDGCTHKHDTHSRLPMEETHDHHHDECDCGHEHHHHGDDCGCGHEHHHHDDDCGCGHEHHHHDDDCGCGHEHHHHGDGCGCGHEHHHHDDDCGCGHEHHHHDDDCCCGHEHHHHDDDCCCGHEHHHHGGAEAHTEEPHLPTKGTSVYALEHLGCAHCAAKMEESIRHLDGVTHCALTYATGQLRITRPEGPLPLEEIQRICASIESGVVVTEQSLSPVGRKAAVPQDRKELAIILSGAAALILGKLLEHFLPATAPLECSILALAVYVLGYLLCGLSVLKQAAVNISRGKALDEQFLMSIATLGAFAIGEYGEALGVMVFYRVGEYFEERAVAQTRGNVMEALDLRAEEVLLVENGSVTHLPTEQAQVGQTILVRPGDRVPLDCTVLSGESQLDTSAITGESVPVSVTSGDIVTSGWVNLSSPLHLRVEQPLEQSMVTRILHSVEEAAASKPTIDRFLTRFSRVYTPIVVALAVLTAILPGAITGDWTYWVKTAFSFLVISCPCALVLSVPLAFFAGIGAASKQKILFKSGSAMERIASAQAVVMDKTGTLTRGVFEVQQVLPAEGVEADELLAMAAMCEGSSTHPIARSILRAAEGLTLAQPASVTEYPGMGIEADRVLCGNRALMERFSVTVPETEANGSAEVFVSKNGMYQGRILISDELKEDAAASIAALRRQGLTPAILTGDAEAPAKAIAEAVGVEEYHARLLPQDKLSALQAIRKKFGPVLFVGDGINDAPVLAGADVGAAMGSGSDAAIEAADLVFLTNRMDALPKAVRIARKATRISRQNIVFALGVKLLVILLGLIGYANLWMAVFADSGVAMLCVLNSIRLLYARKH